MPSRIGRTNAPGGAAITPNAAALGYSGGMSRRSSVRSSLVALLALISVGQSARADVGPENLLLVVNGDSLASRTAANHYIEARGVADVAVVTLRDLPDWERVDVETFRTAILAPIFSAADGRGLSPQLDAVAYSTGFPTAIDLGGDLAGLDPQPHRIFTPVGSLTGLTTLYEPVLQKRPAEYLAPNANAAFAAAGRGEDGSFAAPPTEGFRRAVGFDANRRPTTGAGRRYLLCTMLGMTDGRGESVAEVVARLRATAAADGTRPAGTVVYCDTADVRSTTRQPLFTVAAAAIEKEAAARGWEVRARVVPDPLPRGEPNLIGLTTGLAATNAAGWGAGGSAFAPGAFADNLTSFGGVLGRPTGQVTLVDWRRFGAAAAGGTVTEPFALAFKFPTPFVHLHRLRGVTLGEAILRSVASPYQYLAVGDPLSNPYARRPVAALTVPESSDDAPLSGTVPVALRAWDEGFDPAALDRWELFVDGKRFAVLKPNEPFGGGAFEWDTTAFPDGVREVTVVAVAADPAQSRGRATRAATVRNENLTVSAGAHDGAAEKVNEAAWGEPLTVWASGSGFDLAGTDELVLRHGTERIGRIRSELSHESGISREIEYRVDTRPLGLGPVTLRAVVVRDGREVGRSAPLRFTVVPPPNRAATVAGDVPLADGPVLRWGEEGGEEVQALPDGLPGGWLGTAGVPGRTRFTLSAVLKATGAGLHRLAIRSNCGVSVAVDGEPAPAMTGPTAKSRAGRAWRSVPVWLEPGRHAVRLTGVTPASGAVLEVKSGTRGLSAVTGGAWRHRAE